MIEELEQNKINLIGIPENVIERITNATFQDEIGSKELPFLRIREKSKDKDVKKEKQKIIFNGLSNFFNKINLADYVEKLLKKEPDKLKWFVDTIFICLINNTAPFLSLEFQSIDNTGITLMPELMSLNEKRNQKIIEKLNKESLELQNNFTNLIEQLKNERDENKKTEILERLKNDPNYELTEGMPGNTLWDYDLKKTSRLYKITQEIKKIGSKSIELSIINQSSTDLENQLYFFSPLIDNDLIIQMIYDYIENCNIDKEIKKLILDYLLENNEFYLNLFNKNKEKISELEKLAININTTIEKENSKTGGRALIIDNFRQDLLKAIRLYNQLFEI